MIAPPTASEMDRLAAELLRFRSEWEFHTFWIGTRLLGADAAEEPAALKQRINRSVGQRVERLAKDLRATLKSPDARFIITWPGGTIELVPQPIYIAGRYLKLSREIPQSRWPCRYCRGQGCERCGGTGKRFQRSVEEILAEPLLAITRAQGTKMHSVGREDVDARMLGEGRPFILELIAPPVRTIDLAAIEEQVNADAAEEMAVRGLRFTDSSFLHQMRHLSPDKSYRARVRCLVPAAREAAERLNEVRELLLSQETPRRVMHRRPNLKRRRTVRWCRVEKIAGDARVTEFDLILRVESGTYIKEFISGDEGRTEPSLTRLLNVPCDCVELDVLEVFCEI